MGECRYCHGKAGLFKDAHQTCAQEADQARESLRTFVSEIILSSTTPNNFKSQIDSLRNTGRLTQDDAKSVSVRAADQACLKLALNNPISNDNAERIGDLFTSLDEKWHEEPAKLVNWPGYVSLMHSNTIFQVLHKEIPYQNAASFSDFRLESDEHPITRRNATLAEYRNISNGYNFQSVGIPIGGGMYYRIGTSHPRTQQTGLVPVDQGLMVITTKAIIFSGQQRNFRLPYSSILRLESFVDGFGIHENYGKGLVFIPAQIISADEGWYFYNLIAALLKW